MLPDDQKSFFDTNSATTALHDAATACNRMAAKLHSTALDGFVQVAEEAEAILTEGRAAHTEGGHMHESLKHAMKESRNDLNIHAHKHRRDLAKQFKDRIEPFTKSISNVIESGLQAIFSRERFVGGNMLEFPVGKGLHYKDWQTPILWRSGNGKPLHDSLNNFFDGTQAQQ